MTTSRKNPQGGAGDASGQGPGRQRRVPVPGRSTRVTVKEIAETPGRRKEGIVRWLGGKSLVDAPLRSDMDFVALAEKGVARASLDALTAAIGVTRKAMAEEILGVSVKTIERKTTTARLDRKLSSHILEIARVMEHACNVFEDEERVRLWFNRENRALGGQRPLDLFDTLTGLNLVNDVLGRIEEGVYT